jgi:hypothetical protein
MNDFLPKVLAALLIIIGVVAAVSIFGLLLAWPVKWCWNYTMPYLFALKEISWGQAWCLNFLSGMLIKSTLSTSK